MLHDSALYRRTTDINIDIDIMQINGASNHAVALYTLHLVDVRLACLINITYLHTAHCDCFAVLRLRNTLTYLLTYFNITLQGSVMFCSSSLSCIDSFPAFFNHAFYSSTFSNLAFSCSAFSVFYCFVSKRVRYIPHGIYPFICLLSVCPPVVINLFYLPYIT